MGITIAGQTWLFLLSIALGAGLGVCYDLFRILRIALPHPTLAVLAEDLLFSYFRFDWGRSRISALLLYDWCAGDPGLQGNHPGS